MKKVLGLDLGTNSIGWAYVHQAETGDEQSSIIQAGTRAVPLTVDEMNNFEKGKAITTNADRTLKRSARRNLFRYKLRRTQLIKDLKAYGIISDDTILTETGNRSTFETYRLRAKAVTERVELDEFARILLMLNKKRGYKSNRKIKETDEGTAIDGMETARIMYEEQITPGEYALRLKEMGYKAKPDFYPSDLRHEFDLIWDKQRQFHPEIFTDDFRERLYNCGKAKTAAEFNSRYGINTAQNSGKEREITALRWRVSALHEELDIEQAAYVIADLNGQITDVSGYLGKISDRSKVLIFNKQTIGQYLMAQHDANPNSSLKNIIFYRKDYNDEFEAIWECQAKYHPQLTPELKHIVRDEIIFYQRPLKSKKGLISICELEGKNMQVKKNDKKVTLRVGPKVAPRSSVIFQDFKVWSTINNIKTGEPYKEKRELTLEEKKRLAAELTIKGKLDKTTVAGVIGIGMTVNFESVSGNSTISALYKAYDKIVELSGHEPVNFKKPAAEIIAYIEEIFTAAGIDKSILAAMTDDGYIEFPDEIERLWHLLYSYEADKSASGDESLIRILCERYSLSPQYAKIIAHITLEDDYGNLSTKAMRAITPHLRNGNTYDKACELAGYNHSRLSLTKEEIEDKPLKNRLNILPKNSLRNPVVEKILNQMIHVVNGVSDTYGKPDEIHIELARELRLTAKQRKKITSDITKNTKENERVRTEITELTGNSYVSRNDIIRYRLWEELKGNGWHTLYSNTYIPKEKIFSREFEIEHIIPQARLYEDSFSNKTLELSSINKEKGDDTAYDFVLRKYGHGTNGIEEYTARLENMERNGALSPAKIKKLKKRGDSLGGEKGENDFIARDLTDTQYIARQARLILLDYVKNVISTSGEITSILREDWGLTDILKELNWEKYDARGLTSYKVNREGKSIRQIDDWSKRNDQRHHAMDAITIAFTQQHHIQYLNTIHARDDNKEDYRHSHQYKDRDGRWRFTPPMQEEILRAEVKDKLEELLVSYKAKNKVVTPNINKTKCRGGVNQKNELTPRSALHKETVYGMRRYYVTKEVTVGAKMTREVIMTVADCRARTALLERLEQFGGDAKKAFTGANAVAKKPVYYDKEQTRPLPDKVKCVTLETIYTKRVEVSPYFKTNKEIDKVTDPHVRKILRQRLADYGGDPQKAFTNIEDNPIWLNREKGITIKRVTITGVSETIALHDKRDRFGQLIYDANGNTIPTDYVQTGNNHHVAIFEDPNGDWQEHVVSYFEATERALQHQPVIDRNYNSDKGWHFLFTMKQNEFFVFPRYEQRTDANGKTISVCTFDPSEIDLTDRNNFGIISPNLFRVQKLATKNYTFRHHLETMVDEIKELRDITWKRITAVNGMKGAIKVRINHIGQIIYVGEY